MATEVLMPALSPTMTEGKIARWLKNEGEPVRAGDVLAEIETDKATMEVEAIDEGVLAKIVIPEGTEHVAVNTPIAVIAGNGEDMSAVEKTAQSRKRHREMPVEVRPATTPLSLAAIRHEPPVELEYAGKTRTMTVREALRDAMAEEMRRDDTVFVMGEEVAEYQGAYKVTQGLLAEFGARRVVDTPITEHGFAGLGVGAALAGLRPIVFRGPNGAAARVAAQHSQDYAAWFSNVPGLKVVAPHSAADAKGLLKASIRDPNPVIFLENEILYGHSFPVPTDPDFLVPIGRARVLRTGQHVTITAFSLMVDHALKAAKQLASEGIEAEVIDLRTIRPLDTATVVESVRRTNRLVSVEEGWPFAGVGSELAAVMMEQAFDYLDAPVARVAGADVPLPYAANLERLALPHPEQIVAAARQV